MIRFACPTCRAALSVPDDAAGKKGPCPKGGQRLRVPLIENKTVLGEPIPAELTNRTSTQELALEVLPADLPEVLPVDLPEVLPAEKKRPRLDQHRRYWLTDCDYCGRHLRVPVDDSGMILSCPSCRFYFKAPGRLEGRKDGLPVNIIISAVHVLWPLACACCMGAHDTFIPVTHTRFEWWGATSVLGVLDALASAETSGCRVPYCWDCVEHVKSHRESLCKKACPIVKCAVNYDGWYGTHHAIGFYNWRFANEFIRLNYEKILT